MKTKITMKVKHFVTILFSVFVVLPLVGMFLFPQIELVIAKHTIENEKVGGKEKVLDVLESRILPHQKYSLISQHILGYQGYEDYDVYVGPTMSSISHAEETTTFTWEEKLKYVEAYLEDGPIDYGLHAAAVKLANYAASQGDIEWAESIYKHALERSENKSIDHIYHDISLSYAKLLFRENELDKAEAHLIDMMQTTPEAHSYIFGEAAEYYFQTILRKGNQEEAAATINQLMDDFAKNWRDPYENKSVEHSEVYRKLVFLEKRLHNTNKWSEEKIVTVSGHLKRADGTPLARAGVYLRNESLVHTSITYEDRQVQVTTDENGYYEMKGVTPGKYQMFAGFTIDHIDGHTWPVSMDDWIIVDGSENISYDITLAPLMDVYSPVNDTVITDDEITFAWEEVPEAAYYLLGLNVEYKGGSSGIILDIKFSETEVTIPIDKLYHHSPHVLISKESMEWEYFDPAIYLGFANPDGRFSWNISAYNQDGELLTRSNGYRLNESNIGNVPVLYLKERELTSADRLLVDGKIEEALEAYRKNVEANSKDAHSLRMISTLIGIEGDGKGRTFDKMRLPYLEKLAILTEYDSYFESVLYIYEEQGNQEAYDRWKALYEEITN
ncbi:hypothetical protein [Oceanobacillus sp. CAU 1775]